MLALAPAGVYTLRYRQSSLIPYDPASVPFGFCRQAGGGLVAEKEVVFHVGATGAVNRRSPTATGSARVVVGQQVDRVRRGASDPKTRGMSSAAWSRWGGDGYLRGAANGIPV